MIDELVKIHDKFSVEIKLRFQARKKLPVSDFTVNTWIFIPSGLDINRHTYSKESFYRDIRSNIRLITPVFLLRDIASSESSPLKLLEKAMQNLASQPGRSRVAEYEYHIKMFLSILKSSLRDEINHIIQVNNTDDLAWLIDSFCNNARVVAERYRSLSRVINTPTINQNTRNYYMFGDEFMSNIIEQHVFRLMQGLKEQKIPVKKGQWTTLTTLIRSEIGYRREKRYPVIEKECPQRNRDLIFRFNLLKKYAESELFLKGNKKRDGLLVEQIYFSLAAGISMVFATAIAFSFQQKYGNFTMPFFVALVISYMLKDRIKELGRYYFAHKLGKRYFDQKTDITLSNTRVGFMKEAMDFIPSEKVPAAVMKARDRSAILEANNRFDTEKIILYRKLVRLNRKSLDECSQYSTPGMNDIVRLNVMNYIQKMDNPVVPLFLPDDDNHYQIYKGERIYYINIVLQYSHEGESILRRYRVVLNRKGIREIENFDIT